MTLTNPEAKTVSNTQFYTWKNYHCAYEVHHSPTGDDGIPLLLIHPIGVGLSRNFWQRFCEGWYKAGHRNPIYNPDLLGCGDSDKPHVAYRPGDWAEQLQHFLQTVVQKSVIVLVQGALFPVAIELVQQQTEPNLIGGLVLAGPPALRLLSQQPRDLQHRLTWNLLDSPFGKGFYRYARRREFLRSFSTRQLFANDAQVDAEWLEMLKVGAENPDSRHAVFAFLAGFWRQNYQAAIASMTQPTLVVLGEKASSISREGKQETPEQRLAEYLALLPNATGFKMRGRNVLPYESTAEFVTAIAPFVAAQSGKL